MTDVESVAYAKIPSTESTTLYYKQIQIGDRNKLTLRGQKAKYRHLRLRLTNMVENVLRHLYRL